MKKDTKLKILLLLFGFIIIVGDMIYFLKDKTTIIKVDDIKQTIEIKKPKLPSSITESEFNEHFLGEAVIIDIRTPLEIYQGKISKDALEIDFYDKYFQQEILKLDNTKTYFIYCAHAQRTEKAKEIMKSIGFELVYDLKGGIITWKGELVE